jgi:hypothetical protein
VPDGLGDCITVFQNVAVPEAQNLESPHFQIGVTPFVIFAFGVLRAIGFDNQPVLEINKIDDVAIDDNLSSEFEAGQPLRPQYRPKAFFGFSWVDTHPFGARKED